MKGLSLNKRILYPSLSVLALTLAWAVQRTWDMAAICLVAGVVVVGIVWFGERSAARTRARTEAAAPSTPPPGGPGLPPRAPDQR
ncbi:hypothetical protein EDD28_3358 [Salana multivorans]|uniref:Uncharacterized protein n=1 Tax=Salana multivorans TaxID=120377 RepID=A0A3N2D2D2_9MICO|nr:hypothetical protein EDD28_3358 [Salana multivorans]